MTSLQWVELPAITLAISCHLGAWVEPPAIISPVSFH